MVDYADPGMKGTLISAVPLKYPYQYLCDLMEAFPRVSVDDLILTEAYGQHEPADRHLIDASTHRSADRGRGDHAPIHFEGI